MLAGLAEAYVGAINDGAVPSISSAWMVRLRGRLPGPLPTEIRLERGRSGDQTRRGCRGEEIRRGVRHVDSSGRERHARRAPSPRSLHLRTRCESIAFPEMSRPGEDGLRRGGRRR